MRNVIIILNLSNFTGSMNHSIKRSDGTYEKIRVDYSDMLSYLVGDRTLSGAYVISQQDINAVGKTKEQLEANQRFVQKLKKFGWTPVRVSYDSKSDLTSVFDTIWQTALSPFANADGSWNVNPAFTDVVFVNGSAAWFDIMAAFFNNGFQVEVAYPKSAVSRMLTANFAFLDMTQFLLKSNAKVLEKTSYKESHGNV